MSLIIVFELRYVGQKYYNLIPQSVSGLGWKYVTDAYSIFSTAFQTATRLFQLDLLKRWAAAWIPLVIRQVNRDRTIIYRRPKISYLRRN